MFLHEVIVAWDKITSFTIFDGNTFWSTPLGLFITATIFICACINIWHPGIHDNWFDRIWYSSVAITVLCAFLLGITGSPVSRNVVQALLLLLSFRFVEEVVVRHWRYKKSGKCQDTVE